MVRTREIKAFSKEEALIRFLKIEEISEDNIIKIIETKKPSSFLGFFNKKEGIYTFSYDREKVFKKTVKKVVPKKSATKISELKKKEIKKEETKKTETKIIEPKKEIRKEIKKEETKIVKTPESIKADEKSFRT